MPSLFELALAYTRAGVSVIPISPNEGGRPNVRNETPFDCREYVHHRIASPEELREWFADDRGFTLGAVLGPISGGLECLDLTYAAVVKLFQQLVTSQGGRDLLERVPAAQSTGAGSSRLYYRCPLPVRGYKRLAQLEVPSEPGTVRLQLLAFVYGEGTWTVLPSLPAAVGEFDDVFEWLGKDLTQAPAITEDERQLLLESASCLNAWADPGGICASAGPDGFDSRVTWEQILIPLRWRKVRDFGEVGVWHSPERTKPGYCAITGIGFNRDLLYMTKTSKAYTKSGAFTSLYSGVNLEKARSVEPRATPPTRWETEAGRRYLRAVKKPPPLVSCITPTTGDRRRFLPQAIRCFQQQTYLNSELVIVCDEEDDLSDLIPYDDKRIRYVYLGHDRHTLGTKRNLACEQAKGDLIAHFDDDDWSHPDRLSFQVGALLAEGAEVCRLSQLSFFEIGTRVAWLYRTPAFLHPSLWLGLPAGGTFLYRRSYWSSSPFPDISLGEDMAFVSAKGRLDLSVLVSDFRLYVSMIHSSNTCDYSQDLGLWSPWPGDIREIMGADLDFYLSLRKG